MLGRMRRSWAIAALALTLTACGSESEPNRFDLQTPGANTGAPVETPRLVTPTPESRKPVTTAERRVIKGWADSLREGRVAKAARYFSVPAYIASGTPDYHSLRTRAAIEDFNRTLTCGSKLVRTRRGAENFVVGIFQLTERGTAGSPSCGKGIGETAVVAFEIKKDHIERWVMLDPASVQPEPTAAPTVAPTTG